MAEEENPQIERLIEQYGEENVRKAFWLHYHIKREGIGGIHFSRKAERKAEEVGPMLVKKAIYDEFPTSV